MKQAAEEFQIKVEDFQADFRAKAPFAFDDSADVYEELDQWHVKIQQVL